MALDELTHRDTQVEEAGLTFLFGPKTSTLVAEVMIDFDDERGFIVYDETIPSSYCE